MCVCVCVSTPRLLITSGMMWCDMDSIRLVKQILQLLYGNCSSLMGVALELVHVVDANPVRVS